MLTQENKSYLKFMLIYQKTELKIGEIDINYLQNTTFMPDERLQSLMLYKQQIKQHLNQIEDILKNLED